jgi:hypothetical protein
VAAGAGAARAGGVPKDDTSKRPADVARGGGKKAEKAAAKSAASERLSSLSRRFGSARNKVEPATVSPNAPVPPAEQPAGDTVRLVTPGSAAAAPSTEAMTASTAAASFAAESSVVGSVDTSAETDPSAAETAPRITAAQITAAGITAAQITAAQLAPADSDVDDEFAAGSVTETVSIAPLWSADVAHPAEAEPQVATPVEPAGSLFVPKPKPADATHSEMRPQTPPIEPSTDAAEDGADMAPIDGDTVVVTLPAEADIDAATQTIAPIDGDTEIVTLPATEAPIDGDTVVVTLPAEASAAAEPATEAAIDDDTEIVTRPEDADAATETAAEAAIDGDTVVVARPAADDTEAADQTDTAIDGDTQIVTMPTEAAEADTVGDSHDPEGIAVSEHRQSSRIMDPTTDIDEETIVVEYAGPDKPGGPGVIPVARPSSEPPSEPHADDDATRPETLGTPSARKRSSGRVPSARTPREPAVTEDARVQPGSSTEAD